MTIIVSYSELFKWDTCPRQYYYNFELGLRPIEISGPINTGVKGHKLLQTFYTAVQEGQTRTEAIASTDRAAAAMVKNASISDVGSLLKSWTLVSNYIKIVDLSAPAVLVENRFLFPASMLDSNPMFDNIQIGFTPDVVFERKGKFVDVEDSKFVGRAWSKSKLNRFQQAKLYQVFLKRMGYNVTRSSVRFFNTTTGIISAQDYVMKAAEEATVVRDFTAAILELVEHKKSGGYPNPDWARRTTNYTACQFCSYEFICTLEAEGKDASKTMAAEFEKSDYDYSV
jgi:hypothetical protein